MPAYNYTCPECHTQELRVAGINDKNVICMNCGHVMQRHVDRQTLLDPYTHKSAAQR